MPATTLTLPDKTTAAPLTPGAVKSGRPGVLWPALQGFIYLAAALALLEGFFYLACVGDSEHIMPDMHVGYKPFANKRITQRKEGFGCFKLNSFGMQNDEVPVAKAPGVYRIAVFGDSYVEALQVAREANYISLTGAKLSKLLGKKVEVLNFGVSNYSVAQDYLRYQTVAKQFKPDLVIQVFRVEEVGKLLPFETQALLFVKPVLFPAENGTVKYDNTCVRQYFNTKEGKRMVATQWLRANSRIWGVLSSVFVQWQSFQESAGKALGAKKAAPNFTLPADETRARYARCYWYMMERQLTCFKNECASEGSQFMFLRTPMIRPGEHKLTDNDVETELLAKTADKLNVPVLNLDQAYRAYAGTKDDGTNFSEGGHFTRKLHVWVADRLGEFLAGRISRAGETSGAVTTAAPGQN